MITNVNDMNRRLSWLVIFLCSGFLISQIFIYPPDFNWTDFPSWRNDWDHLLCTLGGTDGCQSLSKFPVAYLLNSFLSSFNKSDWSSWILSIINFLALGFSIYFVYYIGRLNSTRGVCQAYFFSLIFTVIPPFYVFSGALEVQFGVFLGIFSLSLYELLLKNSKKRVVLVALFISALLLPAYKDTSVILMGIVYFIAVLVMSKGFAFNVLCKAIYDSRRILFLIVCALFLALAINFEYNWHRYGNIFPVPYLIEARDASPPFFIRAQYFFWILFSPNGGLLISWSVAFFVLLLILRLVGQRPSRFGIAASIGLIFFNVLILSNWWTPFGWEGWGNRLILPSAIACLIVISGTSIPINNNSFYINRFIGFRKLSYPYFGSLFLIAILFFSFAYVVLTYSGNRYVYLDQSLWGSDACKAVGQLRDKRPMWQFKKTPLHIKCHLERFSHIPGSRQNMSPLSIVEKKKYSIGGENTAGIIGGGWSQIEEWGVWSDGPRAEIRFIPGFNIKNVFIDLQPFVYGTKRRQQIAIFLNGKKIYEDILISPKVIKINLTGGGDFDLDSITTLELKLQDAASPLELGLSADKRRLGVGLRAIEFE